MTNDFVSEFNPKDLCFYHTFSIRYTSRDKDNCCVQMALLSIFSGEGRMFKIRTWFSLKGHECAIHLRLYTAY